jgi:hypothetical protein
MCIAPEKPAEYKLHNIDRIDSNMQKITEEIDWGDAEQSALERLMDDNSDFISGEEMIDWIDRLKAGEDV